jgi:uncharacterized protein with von Willebrand factor type A (vWA) domain
MITYSYSEYSPEDDNQFSIDRLMSILSDMIMKYDISLEEAMKLLIEKGIPANLFLKEAGMNDLVEKYLEQIKEMISKILSENKISPNIQNLEKEISSKQKEINEKKIDPKLLQKLNKSLDEKNQDALRRLKWEAGFPKEIQKEIDSLLNANIDLDRLDTGDKKFIFSGERIPSKKESLKLLDTLEQLTELQNALKEAIEKGDLFNLDLANLAKFLGAESYQEFMERRDRIFEDLKKILEQNGKILEKEDGEISLSPSSIRKIGMTAIAEIFSKLKAESSGSHTTNEFGDSENITSSVKPFEFGDNISHIDFSGSIINSIVRGNGNRPGLRDLDVHQARGNSKSATIILLDMSGSMARSQRFYNAKKVTLAMDTLIKNDYKDDKLIVVGFGSTAKILKISDLPTLQPYPITIYNPYIKLKYDFSKMTQEQIQSSVPLYFTNLQKGLSVSRQLLSSNQIKNKQIFLITDGAPTAHFKGSVLHINYPPVPSDFEEALSEVKLCAEDNITINTFLLTSEWDMNYFGEQSFIQQFARISKGRIFYPHPGELNQMILYDFVSNKKKKFSY